MRMTGIEYALGRSPVQAEDLIPAGAKGSGRWSASWALAFSVVLMFLSGCSPPDRPSRLPPPLPGALLAHLEVSSHRTLSPGPGVAYYGLSSQEGPWNIHLLRVDLNRCDLGLRILKAPKEEGLAGGRRRVSELEAVREGRVLAAVNGDFFTPEGLSVGTEVVEGVVTRIRNRPALAWRPGGLPWIGIPRPEGDSVLVLGWRVSRGDPDGATQVVGGFPLLLRDGEGVGDLGAGDLPSFSAVRHPRTAVGVDEIRRHVWLVVVDGRRPGYSDGMTLSELVSLLKGLGVAHAVNLDGGGSTVMVLEGVRVSRPSDQEGERPVVNALAVVRDQGFCRVAKGPESGAAPPSR